GGAPEHSTGPAGHQDYPRRIGRTAGQRERRIEVSGNPSSIMMVGLHGSGKTTSSAKLARLLVKQARLPLLVGADVYRPAAMDQLETLGKQLNIPVFIKKGETDVFKIVREAFD